jgi:protein-disulfide isomerase
MSQGNRVGKQNARERVAAEKIRKKKADRRRRQLTVGGVVLGVIAIAGGVGIIVNNAKHNATPYAAPVGAVIDPIAKSTKDLGIRVGSVDAPVKLTVFEDFRCPACKSVEAVVEPVYKQYVEAGKLQVTYHPVRLIDGKNGGTGSRTAGNVAACAQDVGEFVPVHDILYANQPDETADGYSDKKILLALAGQVPALKSDPTFLACVNGNKHDGWIQSNADQFNTMKLQQTPTFFLDGKQYSFSATAKSNQEVIDAFKKDLDAAFTAAGAKAGTPVTLPTAPAVSPSANSSATPSAGTTPAAGTTPSAGASGTPSGTPAASGSSASQPSASSSTTKS